MTSIDLSTSYLGLKLANPFITGASPLGDHLDTVRRLEDAGCAAIALHSLFEEQIRTVSGWSSWLGYQAFLRAHKNDDSKLPS